MRNATVLTQNHSIGHLYGQKWYGRYHYHILDMSIHRTSTILRIALSIIRGQWHSIDRESTYWVPVWGEILVKMFHTPPTIEQAQIINNVYSSSVSYTAMKCIALLLNCVVHSLSFQYILVYNFANMHAMSHRSDFFCLQLKSNNLRTPILPYYNVTFVSLSRVIVQRSSANHDVGFKIIEYLIVTVYDIFQNWSCVYLWFEQPYITKHLWCEVHFNECRFEMSYWLENSSHSLLWKFYLHCRMENNGSAVELIGSTDINVPRTMMSVASCGVRTISHRLTLCRCDMSRFTLPQTNVRIFRRKLDCSSTRHHAPGQEPLCWQWDPMNITSTFVGRVDVNIITEKRLNKRRNYIAWRHVSNSGCWTSSLESGRLLQLTIGIQD